MRLCRSFKECGRWARLCGHPRVLSETLAASVKQKTRWVYGINFEAMHKLGWNGDPWDFYFFLRDRKGMLTNFLPPISLFLLIVMMLGYIDVADLPAELQPPLLASMWINLAALVARYLIRVGACHKVYGRSDWFGVAVRWPVSLYINMAAAWRAWKTYLGQIRARDKAHRLVQDHP